MVRPKKNCFKDGSAVLHVPDQARISNGDKASDDQQQPRPRVQINSSIEEVFRCLPVPTTEVFDIDSTWKNSIETEMEPPPYVRITRSMLQEQPGVEINSIEELFRCLPVPTQVFDIDSTWKNSIETEMEPPPYVRITRNIYHVKKKRYDWEADSGCTNCISPVCSEDCVCRFLRISCSKDCRCSDKCTNRPFRKQKRIKLVKTELCGWGAEAAEPINKNEFIIEYVGEVISDKLYKERLSDMNYMENKKNFYLCQVERDFTIDSTYKGNIARFLNHSCDPNCNLEKWQVDGETRMGIFAARAIQQGEPLTYNYRFIEFGPRVKCHCGASNCQGYLGAKKKASKVEELRDSGSKRKRSANNKR